MVYRIKNFTFVCFNSCLNSIQDIKSFFMSSKSHTASSKSKHKICGVNGISHQDIKIQMIFFFLQRNFVSYLPLDKIVRYQLILLSSNTAGHPFADIELRKQAV